MFMAELSTPSVCLGKILIQVSVLVQPQRRFGCVVACACVALKFFCTLHFLFSPFFIQRRIYFRSFPACSSFISGSCWLTWAALGHLLVTQFAWIHTVGAAPTPPVLGLCGCVYNASVSGWRFSLHCFLLNPHLRLPQLLASEYSP